MRVHVLIISVLGVFLAFLFFNPTCAYALYQQGLQEFEALQEDENRAQYRSHWMDVASYFEQAYEQDPQGSKAADALFYLGRTYEELGKRSYLESDFEKAEKYYKQVTREFTSSSRASQSQYRVAEIHLNHYQDSAQAYIEYLRVVYNHSQSQVTSRAEERLKELDRRNLEKIGKQDQLAEDRGPADSSQVEAASQEVAHETKDPSSFLDAESSTGQEPTDAREGDAELVNIRHWSSDEYTRVVLDLDGQAEYYHKLLDPDPELGTPHRLFVDLEQTRLDPDSDREKNVADGILNRIRSAQHTKEKSRVVLDIQDLEDFQVFALENPFRVVIDVYAPDEPHTMASLDREPQIRLDPESKEMTAQSLVEQLGLKVRTIMIDPGHGGKDPGAVVDGVKEKDIALRHSKILGDKLEDKGFEVLYTRTQDEFVSLEERTAMANSQKADLFISVHANSHRNSNVRGFEVYYLNFAQDEDAKRVAARENSVSTQKISDLQYILTDLMLDSKINESRDLAKTVYEQTANNTSSRFAKFDSNGVRQAPFYVLMGAQMPAILLELGYMSNDKDVNLLQSEEYLSFLAEGLTQGIDNYKNQIEQFAQVSSRDN